MTATPGRALSTAIPRGCEAKNPRSHLGLIGGQPNNRDNGKAPPRITEFLRGFVETNGMGQNDFDIWRPPLMADVAFRPFETSGMGQKARDMWRPPRMAEFLVLCGDSNLSPNSREIGPPR